MAFCHADYRIAWICALPIEMAAARLMLDETHPDLPQSPQDNNAYSLGRIGPHYLVITCLPSGRTGNVSAADVAGNLRWSFPQAQVGFLVGIGGGAPDHDADVRLGDVIVGHPSSPHGSVLQYDFGKTVQDGHFVLTGSVNNPPLSLLAAVSKLRANHDMPTPPVFHEYAEAASKKQPAARRPDAPDILFDASYDHPDPSSPDCQHCDPRQVVTRQQRSDPSPTVHYGLIASANQVMRHGLTRNNLRRQYGVLCFEMEAAGLMDSLPCLVIRGICDYADSHKNKSWQFYAAVIAAAYAKELLEVLSAPQRDESSDSLMRYNSSIAAPLSREAWQLTRASADSWRVLLHRLSDYNPSKAHRRLIVHRLSGTTDWFLSNSHYKEWRDYSGRSPGCLWCFGKVGCGKTMICTRVIDDQIAQSKTNGNALAYFYCDFSNTKTLDPAYIVASLLKQLLQYMADTAKGCPRQVQENLQSFYNPEGAVPDVEDLTDILSVVFEELPDSTFVIDGLNELDSKGIASVLGILRGLWPKRSKQRLFVSSREELGHANNIAFALRVPLDMQNVEADIKTYIESRITSKMAECQITDDTHTLHSIKKCLSEKANGMFTWVHLQIEALWRDCKTDGDIMSALSNLPPDLAETYRRCLDSMPELTKDHAPRVLHWVMFATPPLLVSELREAVAFDFHSRAWDKQKILSRSLLIGSCANLVYEDATEHTVRLAHSSVQQYLLQTQHESLHKFKPLYELGLLRCGELCVNYLSFDDFGLQVRATSNNDQIVLPGPNAILNSTNTGILGRLGLFRPRGSNTYTVPAALTIPYNANSDKKTSDEEKYGLLSYARENWALQTKMITDKSPVWDQFKHLALQANNTWRFQPWAVGTQSQVSYLHAGLAWATRKRHLPLLSLLLRSEGTRLLKEAINLPYAPDGLSALHSAARSGFADVVSELLKYCDVNVKGPEKWTALHFAAAKNHDEVARLFLRLQNLDVSASSAAGSALEVALSHGSEAVALEILNMSLPSGLILKNSISLSAQSGCVTALGILLGPPKGTKGPSRPFGKSKSPTEATAALIVAVKNERLDVTRYLLARGDAEANARTSEASPLRIAAQSGNAEMVQQILSRQDVDPDRPENYGLAALSWAAQAGHEKIVELFLERSHNVAAAIHGDDSADSPLTRAVRAGHEGVVELLLVHVKAHGIRLDSLGTRLIFIAAEEGHSRILSLLLALSEVDLNSKDESGSTLLSLAAHAGRKEDVEMLLAQPKVDANSGDQYGRTPLSYAADLGHKEVVELLLMRPEVSADEKDKRGRAALSYAAELGHKEVVELLLMRPEVSADEKDDRGRTVLSYAAMRGNKGVIELLLAPYQCDLQQGAPSLSHLRAQYLNLNRLDKTGGKPHSYARRGGHITIAVMLEDCARILGIKVQDIR